jgi:hypothetical protein
VIYGTDVCATTYGSKGAAVPTIAYSPTHNVSLATAYAVADSLAVWSNIDGSYKEGREWDRGES